MTKKEAMKILRIDSDIAYNYKSADGSETFMTIIDRAKAQADADARTGAYDKTLSEIEAAYNYLQAQYNAKVTGATTTENKKSKVGPILLATGAALVTGALVIAGVSILFNPNLSHGLPNKPGIVQGETQNKDDIDYIDFMGDLTDEKEVQERATEIVETFNKNGIVHTETNTPYTVDEVKVILHYMNGGLLPDGVTVDAANTAYLNMIADMFNTKMVLYNSAYMTGAQILEFDGNGNFLDFDGKIVDLRHIDYDAATGLTIIKPEYAHLYSKEGLGTSEQHFQRAVSNYVPIDVTDFQFGESSTFEYLNWFCTKYNKMLTTTDKKEKVAIFNELTQSLADIVYGNGFQMVGASGDVVVIKSTDFGDYDDVNDYNALRIVVSLYQGARSVVDKEDYELGRTDELVETQDVYRVVTANGIANVNIEQVLGAFNAACATQDKAMNVTDSNGNIVNGDNLDQRAYSNTIHLLNENSENNDLSSWTTYYRSR